jgi:hypothetical protein
MHKHRMDDWNQDDPRFDLTEDDDFPRGAMLGLILAIPVWAAVFAVAWSIWTWIR